MIIFFGNLSLKSKDGVLDASTIKSGSNFSEIFLIVSDDINCEAIDEGCSETEIEDCNGICAPESWLGDGYCDEGNYEYNGNPIFFNCEELNNDEGDCDALGRTTQQRQLPNGKIPIK